MNRDDLIAQVKNEYTRLAATESRQHLRQSTTDIPSDAYYENLLNNAISEINKGTFDNFTSGKEVVTAIANNKSWLSGWK